MLPLKTDPQGLEKNCLFGLQNSLHGEPNPVQLRLFTRMPVTLVQCGRENVSGSCTVEQMAGSSTLSSLSVSLSLVPKLTGSSVKWVTDNQNAPRILMCGSRKTHLQSEA